MPIPRWQRLPANANLSPVRQHRSPAFSGSCMRSLSLSSFRYVALALAACVVFGETTHARPLKKEACTALMQERSELAKAEVVDALIRGPEWTKAHLPASVLPRVQRYLEIEEQLHFRCRGVKVPIIEGAQEPAVETAATRRTPEQLEKPATTTKSQAAPAPQAAAKPKETGKKQPRPKLGAIVPKQPKTLNLAIPESPAPALTGSIPLPERRPAAVPRKRPVASGKTAKTKKPKKPAPKRSDRIWLSPLATND
ncbi:MAG: hypothetical protein Kow0032_12960 [Methyloligellaceae bacterium]